MEERELSSAQANRRRAGIAVMLFSEVLSLLGAFLAAFLPFSSRSQTTTDLRTRAQTMPQGNNSPTTQRLSERSERHRSTNGLQLT